MINVKTERVQISPVDIEASFNFITNELIDFENKVKRRIELFSKTHTDIWNKAFNITVMHRLDESSTVLEQALKKDLLVKSMRLILSNAGGRHTIALDAPNAMIDDVLMYHVLEYEQLYTETMKSHTWTHPYKTEGE